MAIKIPSKNIYEINNPKIRDNVIDNVSVEQTVITPNNEYETTVYNEDIYVSSNDLEISENSNKKDFSGTTMGENDTTSYQFAFAYLDNILGYYKTTIQIPRLQNNKLVKKLYRGITQENGQQKANDVVYFQISGTTKTTPISATVTIGDTLNSSQLSNIVYGSTISQEGIFEISNLPKITTITNSTPNPDLVAKVTGITGNSSYTVRAFDDNSDYIEIEIKVLSYELIEEMTGTYYSYTVPTGKTTTIKGTKIEKIPEKISVTAYGNTIGIDLTDGTVTYGSGNKPHSLSGNELLQNGSTTNGVLLTEHLANNVLNEYDKGKETAVIRCDINEYYDDQNNLVISTNSNYRFVNNLPYKISAVDGGNHYTIGAWFENDYTHNRDVRFEFLSTVGEISQTHYVLIEKGKSFSSITIDKKETDTPQLKLTNVEEKLTMTFQIGDEVIPMVYKGNGEDRPMSLKQDGTAKSFRVVGTNKIYDGAVWQELYLQEK